MGAGGNVPQIPSHQHPEMGLRLRRERCKLGFSVSLFTKFRCSNFPYFTGCGLGPHRAVSQCSGITPGMIRGTTRDARDGTGVSLVQGKGLTQTNTSRSPVPGHGASGRPHLRGKGVPGQMPSCQSRVKTFAEPNLLPGVPTDNCTPLCTVIPTSPTPPHAPRSSRGFLFTATTSTYADRGGGFLQHERARPCLSLRKAFPRAARTCATGFLPVCAAHRQRPGPLPEAPRRWHRPHPHGAASHSLEGPEGGVSCSRKAHTSRKRTPPLLRGAPAHSPKTGMGRVLPKEDTPPGRERPSRSACSFAGDQEGGGSFSRTTHSSPAPSGELLLSASPHSLEAKKGAGPA